MKLLCSFFFILISLSTSFATSYVDSLKKGILEDPEKRVYHNYLIARHFNMQTYGYAPNQDSTHYYLDVAFADIPEGRIDTIVGWCYMYRGKAFAFEGKFVESNEALEKAKTIFMELEDSLYISKMDFIMSKNFQDLGMYSTGISHLEEALARSGNSTDTLFVASINVSLGNYMTVIYEYQASIPFYQKAILLIDSSMKIERGGTFLNIGRSFAEIDEYDSSYFYYQKTLRLWKEADYQRGLGVLYNNLARLFYRQEKHDRAIDYLLNSERILIETEDNRRLRETYFDIADSYLHLRKSEQARRYIAKGEALGLENAPYTLFSEIEELKSLLYEQLGDYKKAYLHQSELLRYRDSLTKAETEENILDAKQRLDFLQKKKEIEIEKLKTAALKNESDLLKARQRQNFFLFCSLFAIALSVVFYLVRQRIDERKLRELKIRKKQEANSELKKEIESRKKKLSSINLQLIDKNQRLNELKDKIQKTRENGINQRTNNQLLKIENQVNEAINTDDIWKEFKHYFEEIHGDFFLKITKLHPSLTSKDLRLISLLKLNLSTKEMANLLNLPIKTVEVARYRLRKKLDLKQADKLTAYIMSV